MSRIIKILMLWLCCASVVHAAPYTPRNNKMLVFKQTIFEDGTVTQGASIATPSVVGSKNADKRSELLRDGLGATPIPAATLNAAVPAVGRYDYATLFDQLTQMQAYQQQLQDDWNAAVDAYYAAYYSNYDTYNGFPPMYSIFRHSRCYWLTAYCMQAPNFAELTNQHFTQLDSALYGFAVEVRRNVANPVPGSEDVIIYATNAFMQRMDPPRVFKQAIIDLLKSTHIEYAWLDLETEMTIGGVKKRIASSMQISSSDTVTTPGQYIGAALIPLPGQIISGGRRNTIDVIYYTASQYPDVFNVNQGADAVFADASNYGILSWTATSNGDPLDGTGSGYVQTNGAYDDIFHDENIGTSTTPVMVRTINNVNQYDNTRGVDCLVRPLTTGCISGYPNLLTLMQNNNAGAGTFTYIGRWELQHATDATGRETAFPPLTADARETLRGVEYNLCYPVKFYNEIQVRYTIRRLIRKYTLVYADGKVSLVPVSGYPRWEVDNHAVPNYTIYQSYGDIVQPRDPQPNPDVALEGVTEDALLHTAIINPVTWSASKRSLTPYKDYYNPTTGITTPSWESRMSQSLTTTIYKSTSLPDAVTDPTARYYYFTCEQRNRAEIDSLTANADAGSVAVTGDTSSCTVAWTSTMTANSNPDPTGVPIWGPLTTAHTATLSNPACEEMCPADGSTLKLCPR